MIIQQLASVGAANILIVADDTSVSALTDLTGTRQILIVSKNTGTYRSNY